MMRVKVIVKILALFVFTIISMGSLTMTIDPQFWTDQKEIKLVYGNDYSADQPTISNTNIVTKSGLYFTHEPPSKVTFFNTDGIIVDCKANSSESMVKITWSSSSGQRLMDFPGLRYIRNDGYLVFPPFSPNDYKQSIHSTSYICIATDNYGSISSRLVTIKGVIRRSLTIHVHDQHILPGGIAAFTCHISGFESTSQLMEVSSWLEEPSGRVITTIPSKLLTIGTLLSSKYLSLDDGRLYISSVSSSLNNNRYRCRVTCRLTGEILTSSSAGRLIVGALREPFPPRITLKSDLIIGEFGSQVIVTCIASGYPLPHYKWIPRWSMVKQHQHHLMMITGSNKSDNSNENIPSPSTNSDHQHYHHHHGLKDGDNIIGKDDRFIQVNQFLIIKNLNQSDMGTIGCWANNSLGHDKVSIQLMVRSPLRVNLSIISEFERDSHVTLINCDYTGYPVTSIEWRFNGHPLNLLYPLNGSSTIKLLNPSRLKIESATEKEQGYFQCFVSNEYESVNDIVQLKKSIIALQFLETFDSVILSEGDSVTLSCKVEGYPIPRVTWTLDHQPITTITPKRDIITQSDTKENVIVSLLKLQGIILLDGGSYGCVAENSGKKITHIRKVQVRGLPFIKSLTNRITIAGSQLTVHCPVVGYPIDRLIWIKDGQVLSDSSNQKVHSDGSLELRNQSKIHDQGKYTCRAFQGNYSSESSFTLSIQVKPVIETFKFPSGLHEGQRASISCTVATGDYPIIITWIKDLTVIPNESISPKVISVSDYSSSLLFESLDVTHRGNYTCRATNEAGLTEHSAYLEINEAPLWTLEPIDSWSIKGNKVIIHCQATGFPIPRIRWSRSFDSSGKEFKPIASNPHIQVHENGSLIIHETITSDSGYYLCQAHNSVGPGLSKVVNLNVYVKAHFIHHKFHNYSKLDDNTTLNCIAHGDDPLDIQWFKDDQTIGWNYIGTLNHQHHSYGLKGFSHYQLFEEHLPNLVRSELIISSAKRTDNGIFMCRSSNSFGTDELIIQLTIQEPPGQPSDLILEEISSRWVSISWKTEFDGHSPITNHLVQYIEHSPSSILPELTLTDRTKVMIVMGDSMVAKVTGLRPGQRYSLIVMAENALGRGNSSLPILVTTEEEQPSTPPINLSLIPLSSSSIRITWDRPEIKGHNGQIQGYHIGIREANEVTNTFTYHTFNVSHDEVNKDENDDRNNVSNIKWQKSSTQLSSFSQRLSIILDNLRQLTKYTIIVHSFNSKGSSPASTEKHVTTFGIDLPSTPNPSIVYISSTSIHITWTQIIDDSHPIQGYHIYHRTSSSSSSSSSSTSSINPDRYGSIDSDKWSQITLIGHQTFYTFQGLDCGTMYNFYLVAYNSMGLSPPSDIIYAKTNGSLPITPDYTEAIYQNSSSTIYISLEAWRSSGCPIEEFSIRYQITSGLISRWNELTIPNDIKLKGLIPIDNSIGSSIDKIQISVRNKLGITKVEYIFSPTSSSTSSSWSSTDFLLSSNLSRSSKSGVVNVYKKSNQLPKIITNRTHNGYESTLLSQLIYYAAWASVIWLIVLLFYFATKSKIWTNMRDNLNLNSENGQNKDQPKHHQEHNECSNSSNVNLSPSTTLPLTDITNSNGSHCLDQSMSNINNCMTLKLHDSIKDHPPETMMTMVKMTGNGASYEPLYSTIMKKPLCKLVKI